MSADRQTRHLLALLVIAGMALLAGCSTPPTYDFETLPPIGQYQPSQDDLEMYSDNLAQYATSLGIDSPPEVSIVRWVNPEESPAIMVECLVSAGVSATLDAEHNSYGITSSAGQHDSTDLARYICLAKFPVRLDIYRFPSEAEQRMLYQYLVDEWLPCMTREGFPLSKPSLETYTTYLRNEGPNPLFYEFGDKYSLSATDFNNLMQDCPQQPPGWRAYGR